MCITYVLALHPCSSHYRLHHARIDNNDKLTLLCKMTLLGTFPIIYLQVPIVRKRTSPASMNIKTIWQIEYDQKGICVWRNILDYYSSYRFRNRADEWAVKSSIKNLSSGRLLNDNSSIQKYIFIICMRSKIILKAKQVSLQIGGQE